jgi:hypothetical protein
MASIQSLAAKDCHCERSEAISKLGVLLLGPSRAERGIAGQIPLYPPLLKVGFCSPFSKGGYRGIVVAPVPLFTPRNDVKRQIAARHGMITYDGKLATRFQAGLPISGAYSGCGF